VARFTRCPRDRLFHVIEECALAAYQVKVVLSHHLNSNEAEEIADATALTQNSLLLCECAADDKRPSNRRHRLIFQPASLFSWTDAARDAEITFLRSIRGFPKPKN